MKTCRKGLHQYDGSLVRCPECGAERKRAYREANREKLNERMRAYREANREKLNERMRAYREANREKLNERKRAYREANREKLNERKRAYRDRVLTERAWQTPGTLRVMFAGDKRARKLIALAFGRGATPNEREVAIIKLKARRRPDLCQPTRTTYEETQNTQRELVSPSI